MLVFPLATGGGPLLGIVGFYTARVARPWSTPIVNNLKLAAQVFANALARKLADEALHTSEARLNLAAEAASIGLWSLNLATNQCWLTPKTRELLQFPPDQPISFDRFLSLVHPEDQPNIRQIVQGMAQSHGEAAAEYRVTLPDGSVRYMSSRGRVRRNPAGEPEHLMGVTTDITPRKLAEEATRLNSIRLASAIEAAGLGFYETVDAEHATYLDERIIAMAGLPPRLRTGRPVFDFWFQHIHPDDQSRILDLHGQLRDGKLDRVSAEYRYQHPERGLLWIHHLVQVLQRHPSGQQAHCIGVFQDITEQKQAQIEAGELRDKLAHIGRVTLLGQLASALAHELSQPLGAILRNAEAAELMLEEALPDLDELKAIIADIRADDHRAGQVIDRLRSLLKRRSLNPQPVHVDDIISEVLVVIQAAAHARQVRIKWSGAPALPPVLGDRIHLQQVLINLIVNAMDAPMASAPTDRRVHIQAELTAPDWVVVRVSDNGPGFPGTAPEQLFEPFFTTKTSGLGMGLAVSKTIIEAHQGRIWAENRPAGGACFSFTLPSAGCRPQITDAQLPTTAYR